MSSGDERDQERLERIAGLPPPRGPKGETGEQGKRGGLSVIQGRAVVILFLISAGLSVFAIFWINHQVHASAAALQKQAADEKAVQRAQGAALERKLCASLNPLSGLASLKPPAGDPKANPSRAYEQALSAKLASLAQLGPDLGCPAATNGGRP